MVGEVEESREIEPPGRQIGGAADASAPAIGDQQEVAGGRQAVRDMDGAVKRIKPGGAPREPGIRHTKKIGGIVEVAQTITEKAQIHALDGAVPGVQCGVAPQRADQVIFAEAFAGEAAVEAGPPRHRLDIGGLTQRAGEIHAVQFESEIDLRRRRVGDAALGLQQAVEDTPA